MGPMWRHLLQGTRRVMWLKTNNESSTHCKKRTGCALKVFLPYFFCNISTCHFLSCVEPGVGWVYTARRSIFECASRLSRWVTEIPTALKLASKIDLRGRCSRTEMKTSLKVCLSGRRQINGASSQMWSIRDLASLLLLFWHLGAFLAQLLEDQPIFHSEASRYSKI